MIDNDIRSLIDSIKKQQKNKKVVDEPEDKNIYSEFVHCKKCRGTLYVSEGVPCTCMKEYIRLNKYKDANINKKYYDTTLDFYTKNMKKMVVEFVDSDSILNVKQFVDYMKKYIKTFEHRLYDGRGFFLIGECGCGKTGLLSYMVKSLKLIGYDTYYIDTNELLDTITKSYNNDSDAISKLEKLKKYDLLVLDDFGSEYGKEQWRYNIFLKLIKTRYSKNKPTLMSSNLEYEDLFNGFSSEIIPRLSSVFSEIFDMMCLSNTIDMRKHINNKQTLYEKMNKEV